MPSWRCLFAVPPPRHGVEAFLLLIARIVAGVMFCVSGWNKVFTDAG
ncbi:TPA: DoxX family protein, partial [Stenotrophomonas maltophilia]|nr:DoxX family protein [Stenotrophomonas maltophilia]HDX0920153.1 DoxX family protein [Stenotrophomonas maltophilia]